MTCHRFVMLGALLLVAGCNTLSHVPDSLGERESSYSYIPLDPLPVDVPDDLKSQDPLTLLKALPDQAVRIAVGEYDSSGTLVFGPGKLGVENKKYQVVLDYISVDTANVPLYITKTISSEKTGGNAKIVPLFGSDEQDQKRSGLNPNVQYRVDPVDKSISTPDGAEIVNVPVYVGVGLRLTASITVTKGSVSLSSLGAIAANAEAGNLTGSLVVQTLGITGKSVSASLPLPSELNQTTVQNAILALGSIKAVMYDKDGTFVRPRVVGIYNPIGGGPQIVNGIISVLASNPVKWQGPGKVSSVTIEKKTR